MNSGAGTKGMDGNGQLEEGREGEQLQPPMVRTGLGWCETATSEHNGLVSLVGSF